MGVTLTFKSKSCCSSCLRGAAVGVFSLIHRYSHLQRCRPREQGLPGGSSPSAQAGAGTEAKAEVEACCQSTRQAGRWERCSPAAAALMGGRTPDWKKIRISRGKKTR